MFNSWMKKLLNLGWSFSNIDNTWKNKTCIISTETSRIVINLSKTFLQTQSFFIVWNQKQMIFVLEKTGSRDRKLLNFKISGKTCTQDSKAISNSIYPLSPSVICLCSILWYRLIGTERNPCVPVNLESPIMYSKDTSTLLLTLELCSKPLGIFQRVIKNYFQLFSEETLKIRVKLFK